MYAPQQATVESSLRAQVCAPPPDMSANLAPRGVGLLTLTTELMPSCPSVFWPQPAALDGWREGQPGSGASRKHAATRTW